MGSCAKILAALIACQTVTSGSAYAGTGCNLTYPVPKGIIQTYKNLTYEITAAGQVEQLDLYLPINVANPSLVVQIHGGGFVVGDKSSIVMQADILVENGFAVANLNYRLSTSTSNQFPAAVQDVRCAVRWLRAQSATYGYQSAKIGALGYSAGGNLASMLGAAGSAAGGLDSPDCTAAQYPPAVQAVASYYGLYDFTITTSSATYLGGSPINNPLSAPASPALYVNAATPPFFMARGDGDTTIPSVQQVEMAHRLTAAGVSNQSHNIPGLTHGFNPFSQTMSAAAIPSTCAMLAFLGSNLQ